MMDLPETLFLVLFDRADLDRYPELHVDRGAVGTVVAPQLGREASSPACR